MTKSSLRPLDLNTFPKHLHHSKGFGNGKRGPSRCNGGQRSVTTHRRKQPNLQGHSMMMMMKQLQTVSLKMFLKLFTGWDMIFIATSRFSKCSNMASFQTLLPRGHNKKLILIRNFWVVRCRWDHGDLSFNRACSVEFCYPILK